jgi:molybdopterin-guanine dinucleotide biosynthesis protein A
MSLTGVILCGGKSLRMGEDKGLIQYKNKHLVEYPLAVIKEIASEIFLSTSNKEYEVFGYPLVSDMVDGLGPIGGIYSSMKRLNKPNYFFISCDIPNVSVSLAKKIMEHTLDYEIVVYKTTAQRIQPLFGYYSLRVFDKIKKQVNSKNYKMTDLLGIANTYYIQAPNQQSNIELFYNVNSRKDVR